jgi:hypothetical protein
MRGNLIISRNNAFYNINNNLIKVDVEGNYNKVFNRYKIIDLIINGNHNKIEVLGNGKINNIKIHGNNNQIFINNHSNFHYDDFGVGNEISNNHSSQSPQNNVAPINLFFQNNNNPFLQINQFNNNNNQIEANFYFNNLEEKLFSQIPLYLKLENKNACSLCNKIFLDNEKVKISSCKIHFFHVDCLKNFLSQNRTLNKCPKCPNNNYIFPSNPFMINQIKYPYLRHINDSFSNENDDIYDDDLDDLNNLNYNDDDLAFNNSNDFDEEMDDPFYEGPKGLNKTILDNMEISKIKDVEKLDNDKKKCTICLENYVNGDDSIALPCIHIFHATCIKTWLKNQSTCPICKYEIKFDHDEIEMFD